MIPSEPNQKCVSRFRWVRRGVGLMVVFGLPFKIVRKAWMHELKNWQTVAGLVNLDSPPVPDDAAHHPAQ